jgi:2-hydroxycyclohexanecarboxyl-CoA dehydrogenase
MTTTGLTDRFAGRTALVTGAGGGIGSAISRRLAEESAHVFVADANDAAAKEVADSIVGDGQSAEPMTFDLLDPSACADAVQRVIKSRGDLLSLTQDDWDLSFAVNVDSLFHLCRAALPHMIEAGGGAIVNTASQWGLYPAPAHIAYNVSKAAVVAFTKNLARDYASHNIRVNAVAPGEVHTPMLESGLARNGRTVADLDALVPFGRIGRPEEVAALVAFLASDEAPYICGSVVEITGAQAVA